MTLILFKSNFKKLLNRSTYKMKKHIIFLMLIILCSCSQDNNSDKSIIIKIGQLEITKYEYERNRTREMITNTKDSSILHDSEKIAQWKKSYLDRCYIITDAYQKGYDTTTVIKNLIDYMGNYMMCIRYGYLWKATISPIVDKAMEITPEKIEKRKKLYYFDVISCNNLKNLLTATNGDTVISTKEEFLQLKSKSAQNGSFTSNYFSQQWPFIDFWNYKDYLFNMKEGEVSQLLLQHNKYFYFYLDHVEEVPVSQNDRKYLSDILQSGTEEELIKKTDSQRDVTCQPVLNQDNISVIASFIKNGNTIFRFNEDIELIKYKIDGVERKIGFNAFLQYYSNQPLRRKIENKETLTTAIKDYYMDDYLINEAKKLDLYNSDNFKLDQKTYQNNLLYEKYIVNEITNKLKIDSSEIVDYYEETLNQYSQPKIITAKLYVFKDGQSAVKSKNTILQLLKNNDVEKTGDTTSIKGLVKYLHTDIDMESTNFSVDIKNMLLNTEVGKFSVTPIPYNGNYVLLFKVNEEGKSYIRLDELYGQLEYLIKSKKTKVEERNLVSQLKKKYKLEIDKTRI